MTADRPGRRSRPFADDSPLDAALAFLDLAYECAESPSRLGEALSLLAELVGAPGVLLFSNEEGERRLVAAAHAPSRPANEGAALHLRSDRVRTIPLSGGLELVADPGALQPFEEGLLLRLAPHLARALRIAGRRNHDDEDGQQSAARLDRLALAVVLLDREGRVVVLNRAARSLLSAARSIELSAHRLELRHGVTRALFDALVERVAAPPDPERQFVGGRLALADPEWRTIDLVVAPYRARVAHAETAIAVLLSAQGLAPTPEERLRDLYGLDAEEARVAIDIVAGRPKIGSEGGAEELAANQAAVASLYRKLGTTRQADLLGFVLRPPGVVFESAASRARGV